MAGFLCGEGVTGLIPLEPGNPIVATLAELALFSVLYTDGMRVGWAELRSAWRLPGRALHLGLPLTVVITAAFAHWIAGLPCIESLLIGAVLAPPRPGVRGRVGGQRHRTGPVEAATEPRVRRQ